MDPQRALVHFEVGNQVDFTLSCSDKGSGPITAQFKENVYEYVQLSHSEGLQVCSEPDDFGAFVTPCDLGYVPSIGTERPHRHRRARSCRRPHAPRICRRPG